MLKSKVRSVVMTLAVAALSGTLLAPASLAQSGVMRAKIPFSFYALDKLMPAGTYKVTPMPGTAMIRISNDKGNSIFLSTVTAKTPVEGHGRLVFHKYGSASFLTNLQWPGSESRRALPKTRYESELLAGTAPTKVAVVPK